MRFKTSYTSAHQNTFYIYWCLIKLQNAIINSFQYVIRRGLHREGGGGAERGRLSVIVKVFFLFTGRWAYYWVGFLAGVFISGS